MKNTIFAFKDDSPKYKQIYEKFKFFIDRGDIPTGDSLPSIRQLAESLQVSRNTTLMAYELLVAEGYIRGEGRKGYFVNKLEPLLFQDALVLPNKKQPKSETPVLIDFRAGAVDQTNFPLKIWRRIANKVLTLKESFQYGEPFGEVCLRKQDFSKLKQMRSRLIYITPSHQSPIGVSISIQQRQMLIHWAIKRDGYIIEDDYDSEFRYTQQPFPALASIDSTRVIYLGNFSKSFLPGIRLSYMVLPQQLLNRYKNQFLHFECTSSLLSQLTMAKFMEDGEWIRHIKRMRLVYKRKMQCLVSELKKQFKQNISIIGEQSGLYVLVKIHLKCSEECLIERASFYGVKVYPTSIYFIKNHADEAIIKLGFSNLTCEEIELGVKLLKKAWS